MRRADREVTEPSQIRRILEEGTVLHLAMHGGAYPYLLPVNYGFTLDESGLTLFFHGAGEGRKAALLARDARVCVEIDCAHQLIPARDVLPCSASYAYASLVGQGDARQLDDPRDKEAALVAIVSYYGVAPGPFAPEILARTAVYRIRVESYQAKCRPALPG